jgi:hypothetical protein
MHVATKLRPAATASATVPNEVRIAHNTHVSRLVSFRPDENKMAAAEAEKATYQPPAVYAAGKVLPVPAVTQPAGLHTPTVTAEAVVATDTLDTSGMTIDEMVALISKLVANIATHKGSFAGPMLPIRPCKDAGAPRLALLVNMEDRRKPASRLIGRDYACGYMANPSFAAGVAIDTENGLHLPSSEAEMLDNGSEVCAVS